MLLQRQPANGVHFIVSLLSKHLRGVDQVNPPIKPYSSLRTTVLKNAGSELILVFTFLSRHTTFEVVIDKTKSHIDKAWKIILVEVSIQN